MKARVVIFTLCIGYALAIEFTEEQKQQLKPHKDACIAETKTLEALVDEIEKTQVYPQDGSLDCYSACMFKRLGFVTDDDEFDEEFVFAIMSQTLPVDILTKAIEACKNEVTKDSCETAGKLITCFLANGAGLN